MQFPENPIVIILVSTIVLASPFTIKMFLEWYKIKKEHGVNIFENPADLFSLMLTGEIKNPDIPKESLKAFRISLIGHNLIYLPGFAILLYWVIQHRMS